MFHHYNNPQHTQLLQQIRSQMLEEAINDNNISLINEILESPFLPSNLEQCLIKTVALGNYEIMQLLLTNDTFRMHVEKNEAIQIAAQNDMLKIVNLLLEFPEVEQNIDANDFFCIKIAIQKGHLSIIDRLLQIPAVFAHVKNNKEILALAVYNNQGLVVEKLLQDNTYSSDDLLEALTIGLDKGYHLVSFQIIKTLYPEGIKSIGSEMKIILKEVLHTITQDTLYFAAIKKKAASLSGIGAFPTEIYLKIAEFTVGPKFVKNVPHIMAPLYMCISDKNYIPLLKESAKLITGQNNDSRINRKPSIT